MKQKQMQLKKMRKKVSDFTFASSSRGGESTCFTSTYRSLPNGPLLKKSGMSSEVAEVAGRRMR